MPRVESIYSDMEQEIVELIAGAGYNQGVPAKKISERMGRSEYWLRDLERDKELTTMSVRELMRLATMAGKKVVIRGRSK